jgi:cob(I)alamin adenosyltransferase
MSIATGRGDTGETGLAGGVRVSKADLPIEACGTIDELVSVLGFARSICPLENVRKLTGEVQRQLFAVAASLNHTEENDVPEAWVAALTDEIHRIESMDGITLDWHLPGGDTSSAAYDVARTVCRRAERCCVRLAETNPGSDPNVLAYLNRLSDLLWLLSRLIESERDVDGRLRDDPAGGPPWSRAW